MQKKEMQRRHSLQNLHLSVPEFTRNSQHLFSSLLSFVTFLIIFSHCYISTSINTLGNKELTLLCHEKASSVYVKHLRSETIMRHECFCISCKREM